MHYLIAILFFSGISFADEQIKTFTNSARVAHGLNPLEWTTAIQTQCLHHSVAMCEDGKLSHDGFSERVKNTEIVFSWAGENVAYNYEGGEKAVDQWMNSPGHRENMLKPEANIFGGAAHLCEDGRIYFTAIYMTR